MGLLISCLMSVELLSLRNQVFYLEWQQDKEESDLNHGSVNPTVSGLVSAMCRALSRVPLIPVSLRL